MKFITYSPVSGVIDGVRSISGCRTAQDILTAVYGPDADLWAAIPYDGSDLIGKKIDPKTAALVNDPSYVPPQIPDEPQSQSI